MAEAFELTADMAGDVENIDEDGKTVTVPKFRGATFAYGDEGQTANVADLLEAGNGVIVTDDPQLIVHLEGFPFLKRAKAPENAEPVDTLDDMRVADLRRLPEARDIEGAASMSKTDLVDAVRTRRAGGPPGADPAVDPTAADSHKPEGANA